MSGRRAIRESAMLLAICLPTLAMGGCGLALKASGAACTSTADCSPGQSCNYGGGSATGHCVSSSASSQLQVYLEFQSATEMLPAIQFGPIGLSNGVNQSFVLPQPLSVNGTVQLGSGVTTPVPGAQVLLTAQERTISGRTQQFSQSADANAKFQMLLPLGSYSVRVTPSSASLLPQAAPPPEYLGSVSTSSISTPFVLSLTPATVTIAGTISVLPVSVTIADPSFIFNSLLVSATDAAPQYNAAGAVPRALAEPYTTGSTGAFSMLISPTIGSGTPDPVQLHVTAASGGTPFPSFDSTIPAIQLSATSQNVSAPVATLNVSATRVNVSGTVVEAGGDPVGQATVYFVTQSGASGAAPPFTYSTSVTTDAGGSFSASLFTAFDMTPVTYSIVAQPSFTPTEVSAGTPGLCGPGTSASVTISSLSSAVPVRIVCDVRTEITGSVTTSAGAIVSGAEIEAALKPTASYPVGLVFQTQTQADGSFSMALPNGSYDITITPPAGSGQPVYVSQGVSVGPNEQTIWQTQLFAPFNLAGKIYLGNTSQPFTGTFTAYLSNGTTATAVGQGVAATDGSYSILLPNVGQ